MHGLIYWQGEPVPFTQGETIAATLARNGSLAQVATGGSGWRVFCGIGQCQQCVVLIDGECSAEACLTLARDGMRIEPCIKGRTGADRG